MKILSALILGGLLLTDTAYAMNFSAPVELGKIGSPVQSPYHGFIVEGAAENSGGAFIENENLKTYVKGVARFGGLYCAYDFDADSASALKFGGENNFVLTRSGSLQEILKIDSDGGLELYAVYHEYCTSHLNFVGKIGRRWINFFDSKNLSAEYFGGNDGYKLDGSVIYEKPTCRAEEIIVPYRRWYWRGESELEGEFRFKWDAAAQWFSVEQIIY